MPRRKIDESISDFSVVDGDAPTIAAALGYRFLDFNAFMTAMTQPEFDAFEAFVMKQSSGPKVIEYVLSKVQVYQNIKVTWVKNSFVLRGGGKLVFFPRGVSIFFPRGVSIFIPRGGELFLYLGGKLVSYLGGKLFSLRG